MPIWRPQLWTPFAERQRRARRWRRMMYNPLKSVAGDIQLDANGDVILNADGDVVLDCPQIVTCNVPNFAATVSFSGDRKSVV